MNTMNTYCPKLVSHTEAAKLVQAATAVAEDMGIAIVSVVIDRHARVKAKIAMDNVAVIAESLVEKKANTALLGLTSEAFSASIQPQASQFHSFVSHQDLTLLPGGFPLMVDGELIGAFAIAGALPEQDVSCAKAAMKLTHWVLGV